MNTPEHTSPANRHALNQGWTNVRHAFRLQLGDKTIFSCSLDLCARSLGVGDIHAADPSQFLPLLATQTDCRQYLIRSLPVSENLPLLSRSQGYLRYVPAQYLHYFIDMRQTFSDYAGKFSSKSRATINKKVRKFAEHTGGSIDWRIYKTPDEVMEFHRLARQLSSRTYQEKLLDAGLPESDAFLQAMRELAASNKVRAYLLFHGGNPVAYLYCPVVDGALIYEYLGYDPAYREWSVGTVLQWLALENLFNEAAFDYFDFTEGESDHKRLFSTHHVPCANVFFLKPTLRNRLMVSAQLFVNRFSKALGDFLERHGLKTRIKRLIRFGYARGST